MWQLEQKLSPLKDAKFRLLMMARRNGGLLLRGGLRPCTRPPSGTIEGAKVDQYLLEKSRIVHQNPNERNYHVFYCKLSGLSKEHKEKLHLKDASHYKYLTGGGSVVCEGRDDTAEFSDIKSAMKVLMMTDTEIWDIRKILAALLHMGNIKYKGKVIENLDATDIPDHSNVERVASILGVGKQSLVDALTSKTIFTQGKSVVSTLNTNQSKDIRP